MQLEEVRGRRVKLATDREVLRFAPPPFPIGGIMPGPKKRPTAAAPVVTSISPWFGVSGGGTSVAISGSHFTSATDVKFNGVSVGGGGFTVNNDSSITATTAAGSEAANTTVSVIGPGGTGTLTNAWTYIAASPKLILFADFVTGASPITQMTDQSGQGNHFNQNGGLPAPSLVTNVLNGQPGAQFTAASSQSLEMGIGNPTNPPLSAIISAAAYTYFFAYKPTTSFSTNGAGSYDNESLISDATNGEFAFAFRSTGPKAMGYHWDGADKHADQTVALATAYVSSVKYDGANIKHWLNGSGLVSAAAGNVSLLTGNPRLGLDYTQARFYDGYLFSAIFYAQALSDSSRGVIESMLGHKYGLF